MSKTDPELQLARHLGWTPAKVNNLISGWACPPRRHCHWPTRWGWIRRANALPGGMAWEVDH
jgi:hypothetical protein